MSFSRWMSNNSISGFDDKRLQEENYLKSIIVNPSLNHSYYLSCFKTCSNKSDGFKLDNKCVNECEKKANAVIGFNQLNFSTVLHSNGQ